MHKYLLYLLILVFLYSCATPCPPKEAYLLYITPCGPISIPIEKGMLDEGHKGKWWISEEEYNKLGKPYEQPLEQLSEPNGRI